MNQEVLNHQQSKLILSEFESMIATAQLFIERYYRVRKKLESVYSSASPRKGKEVLSEQQIASLLTTRLKTINRRIMKRKQENNNL